MENPSGTVSNSSKNRAIGRVLLDAAAEGAVNTVLFCINFLAWCTRWTLATAFFVGIMIFAAYFVFNEAVKGGGFEVVPEVVGLPVTRASFVLAEAGLEVGKQRQVMSDRFPEYHVMLQRPAANKVVRSGRKVNLTISAGRQHEAAPTLIGQNLMAARKTIEGTRLLAGSVARIPYDVPRDQVLAQDPPPGANVPMGNEIHLLVSDGPAVKTRFMPDLIGVPIRDALDKLAELGVKARPYAVERVGMEYDVVLEQAPQPGTRLFEKQTAELDVRLLPSTPLPGAWRKLDLVYTVPNTSFRPEIRADVVGARGSRNTVFPRNEDYVDSTPPRFEPGTTITIPISFAEKAMIEFYADGRLHQTFYYEGSAEPVVTEYGGENEVAEAPEDLPGAPVFPGQPVPAQPETPGVLPQFPQ